jgi:hypothetical protein
VIPAKNQTNPSAHHHNPRNKTKHPDVSVRNQRSQQNLSYTFHVRCGLTIKLSDRPAAQVERNVDVQITHNLRTQGWWAVRCSVLILPHKPFGLFGNI